MTLRLITRSMILAAIAMPLPLIAGGLTQTSSIPAALAAEASSAALDSCRKMGFHVSVTVVDAAGVVLITQRDDGAAPHTVSTSQRKAYTALSSRMATSQLTKIVSGNQDAFGMRQVDGFLVLSGGLPIKVGDVVVGAIGISGSPGPDGDEKCAGAAIASIASRLDAK